MQQSHEHEHQQYSTAQLHVLLRRTLPHGGDSSKHALSFRTRLGQQEKQTTSEGKVPVRGERTDIYILNMSVISFLNVFIQHWSIKSLLQRWLVSHLNKIRGPVHNNYCNGWFNNWDAFSSAAIKGKSKHPSLFKQYKQWNSKLHKTQIWWSCNWMYFWNQTMETMTEWFNDLYESG